MHETAQYQRTSDEIAGRCLALHCVAAVSSGVQQGHVLEWAASNGIDDHFSPAENEFLRSLRDTDARVLSKFQWHMEAEWTLLWSIGLVKQLSWPIESCNSFMLNTETMPALGDSVESFLASAKRKPYAELLEEDDKSYAAWCAFVATKGNKADASPWDNESMILYERRYAFEWLDGLQDWDSVTCDA